MRDFGLLGRANRTSPGSLAGLMMMTVPPLALQAWSLCTNRGWLDAGLAPMTKIQSQPSRSASSTVEVPVPMVLASPTPVAW